MRPIRVDVGGVETSTITLREADTLCTRGDEQTLVSSNVTVASQLPN